MYIRIMANRRYLQGTTFKVVVDHKPLPRLYNGDMRLGQPKAGRHPGKLASYDFELVYKVKSDMEHITATRLGEQKDTPRQTQPRPAQGYTTETQMGETQRNEAPSKAGNKGRIGEVGEGREPGDLEGRKGPEPGVRDAQKASSTEGQEGPERQD